MRPKKSHPAVWYAVAIAALALGVIFSTPKVSAAELPPAPTPQTCMLLGDFAVSARAMASTGIDAKKSAETLSLMYSKPDETVAKLFFAVFRQAQIDPRTPEEFATALAETCITRQGNINSFFAPYI